MKEEIKNFFIGKVGTLPKVEDSLVDDEFMSLCFKGGYEALKMTTEEKDRSKESKLRIIKSVPVALEGILPGITQGQVLMFYLYSCQREGINFKWGKSNLEITKEGKDLKVIEELSLLQTGLIETVLSMFCDMMGYNKKPTTTDVKDYSNN